MTPIFIGRFQPFHKGHLKAIKAILETKKEILIIVGSFQEFLMKDNPFSFKERKEMIKRALLESAPHLSQNTEGNNLNCQHQTLNYRRKGAGFKIFGVPDFFDDVQWAEKVLEVAKLKKDNTLVFTQNSWTKECFEKIGVKVRPHPIFFNNLSATEIREKIQEKRRWKNLLPESVVKYLEEIGGEKRIQFLSILPEKRIVDFILKKVQETKAKGAIVGVSGGIDSSVVAFLTKKALGKRAVFLNITFTPLDSGFANLTGCTKNCLLIDNISLLEKKLKTLKDPALFPKRAGSTGQAKIKRIYLGDVWENFLKILPEGDKKTKGNLKPRLRMAVLYYFANLDNFLVVGTANKSEYELGYFTKFGDGGVDILPLADLYKTEVIELAKRLKLPGKIIETIPSANLWPGQTDEKEIGLNYQKLDTVLKLFKQGFSEKEISFLTSIPQNKIGKVLERKRKNTHKLLPSPICPLKPEI